MASPQSPMEQSTPVSVTVLMVPATIVFLFLSRAVYLLHFHPLHVYPGPLLWKISNIPLSYHTFRGSIAKQYPILHRKYGSVVRTAPNELSYTDPQAWKDVHGARKPEFPKDLARSAMPPNGSYSISMAPYEDHARFRRLLAHAFSEQGLREQQPIIQKYVDLLIERLSEATKDGGSTDLLEWYILITFDVIGDLAWGESFNGLRERRIHDWIPAIYGNLRYVVQAGMLKKVGLGWLIRYLVDKETATNRRKNFVFSGELAKKRSEYAGGPRGDFWDRVLIKSVDDNVSGEGMTKGEMVNNASFLALAGGDTVKTALTGITYLLFTHTEVKTKLAEEIRTTFSSPNQIGVSPFPNAVIKLTVVDFQSVIRLKYLSAVIEEGMRLYPAVPAPPARVPPVGGGIVCGAWVPEGTSIQVPQVAMQRMASSFHRPDDFVPERWLANAPPEFANDKKAAMQPFVVGSRDCLGRNLAYAEMRLILSKLFFHFDLEIDEQRTKPRWMDQTAHVSWNQTPLWAKLSPVTR